MGLTARISRLKKLFWLHLELLAASDEELREIKAEYDKKSDIQLYKKCREVIEYELKRRDIHG